MANNPVRWTDPSGRCVQFLASAAGGAATGPGELVIAPASLAAFGVCVLGVWVAARAAGQAAEQVVEARKYPTRLTEVPFRPPYMGPYINPHTGEPQPTGGFCKSVMCKAALAALAAAVLGVIVAGNTEAAGPRAKLGVAQK